MLTLYNDKEAFALCFRTELHVRGNHTNNFAEPQFLVLEDITLQRVKEYNVVGIITKITIELENHYKDKLLSVADGSLMVYTDGGSWAKGWVVVQVLKFQMQMSAVCFFLLWRNSTAMCSKLGAYHKAIKGN